MTKTNTELYTSLKNMIEAMSDNINFEELDSVIKIFEDSKNDLTPEEFDELSEALSKTEYNQSFYKKVVQERKEYEECLIYLGYERDESESISYDFYLDKYKNLFEYYDKMSE